LGINRPDLDVVKGARAPDQEDREDR
jgi:hypothetical protein